VWGRLPSDTPRLGGWEGERCLPVGALHEEAWRWCPNGHSLSLARFCGVRQCSREHRWVLSTSPGAVASASRRPARGRGSGYVRLLCPHEGGACPGGVLDRWSRRCSREPGGATGEPGRARPQHTRGSRPSSPLNVGHLPPRRLGTLNLP
jgi:hypothetical protein